MHLFGKVYTKGNKIIRVRYISTRSRFCCLKCQQIPTGLNGSNVHGMGPIIWYFGPRRLNIASTHGKKVKLDFDDTWLVWPTHALIGLTSQNSFSPYFCPICRSSVQSSMDWFQATTHWNSRWLILISTWLSAVIWTQIYSVSMLLLSISTNYLSKKDTML